MQYRTLTIDVQTSCILCHVLIDFSTTFIRTSVVGECREYFKLFIFVYGHRPVVRLLNEHNVVKTVTDLVTTKKPPNDDALTDGVSTF